MEEFEALSDSAVVLDNRVLRALTWDILGRAYKDYQGRSLTLGGYVDNRRPEEVRQRVCQELKEDAEAWFLGEGSDLLIGCEDILDMLRRLGVVVKSGAEYLEQAKAGVRWPAEKPW